MCDFILFQMETIIEFTYKFSKKKKYIISVIINYLHYIKRLEIYQKYYNLVKNKQIKFPCISLKII